ncbi:MAG: thiamine pyrophosphate-binding protein [Gemmatimonadetes bacterium]|nr:thiamine pyrophosphate-binding protein [Gemmatimonadota bacterium]
MPDERRITGARFIAEFLHAYGVTHLFYVDAILRKAMVDMEELGIRRVVTHSEKAAAYMADGYARVSGRPGACAAQSVGAANLAAGLQDAWLAGVPVLALTGKKPPLFLHRNAYQEIDHWPMFQPVTKYNVDVSAPEQLPFYLRQAMRVATTGRPGPVHVDLVGREARELELATGFAPPEVEATYARYPAHRPQPDPASIELAVQALGRAERPILVAGGGVRTSGAHDALKAMAEGLQIPVATSVNGKGTFDEGHPLSAGVVGSYSAWCANQAVHEADLVIYIGSGTGDQTTHNWQVPRIGARVIQVDIAADELGRSYPGTIGIHADARSALEQLLAAGRRHASRDAWLARVRALRQAFDEEHRARRESDDLPIRPERICRELTAALPDDAILVSDTGYTAIWAATMIQLRAPQTFIRAAGSLGWGFPASLGAKCAAPGRPVICLTGDGGFWYHFAELETARRHGIATVTVVNNNNGFSQGIPDVHRMYGDRPGNPGELYRFSDVSFAQVARDMGGFGVRVTTPGEIAPALQQAMAAGVPAVVEVMTDFSARAPDPWAPPREG